jgi:hypothetical protein
MSSFLNDENNFSAGNSILGSPFVGNDFTPPYKLHDRTPDSVCLSRIISPSTETFLRNIDQLAQTIGRNDRHLFGNDGNFSPVNADDTQDNLQPDDDVNVEEEAVIEATETDEERLQREMEESERFAWELMREESESAYQQQMEFMQQNATQMSSDDFAAVQQLLNESHQYDIAVYQGAVQQPQEADNNGEEEEEEADESEEWDYERLLELGQAIGDVKTERWRLRAKKVIDYLPILSYKDIVTVSENKSDAIEYDDRQLIAKLRMEPRCVICIGDFEETDEVKVVPCFHFFHEECTRGWLAVNYI